MRVSWYEELRAGMVELVQAVTATGGAVGWLSVPPPEEIAVWLACGFWRRTGAGVLSGMAEIRKVMTHPDARGRGAGRAVLEVLISDARAAGVELLTLGCRGNNHGAQWLYAGLGFQVTGRRPEALAIGDERFDQVLMHIDLRSGPAGLLRHGSRNEGPGPPETRLIRAFVDVGGQP